ncbi:MAG: SocA family protein [Desulfovibrio sp.]|nr:SocA family protein [Desulfovibrio sp.]
MSVKFRANTQKIIESIIWIAQRLPDNSRYTILKTLFYADKFHLQKYGRPVTGDTYIKMAAGPVASLAYDLIKRSDYLPPEWLAAADAAFDNAATGGKYPPIEAKRQPDMEWFSATDIECLAEAAAYCSGKGFSALKDAAHQEAAWLAASMNGEMDFALFLDEDDPDYNARLEYILETAPCQAV